MVLVAAQFYWQFIQGPYQLGDLLLALFLIPVIMGFIFGAAYLYSKLF